MNAPAFISNCSIWNASLAPLTFLWACGGVPMLTTALVLSLGVKPQWQSPFGVGPWGTPQTAQQAAEHQLQAMGATAPELVPQRAKRSGEPTCLTARNFLNTQYTVNVGVGGSRFWMVPDSGSFEVLVPSAACRSAREPG